MGFALLRRSTFAPQLRSRARTLTAGRVITAGLLLATAAVLAQTVSQLIDFRVFNLGIRAVDSNHHRSVFGAASIVAQAAAAAGLALRAGWSSDRRLAWLALGAMVAALLVVRTFLGYSAPALAVPVAAIFGLLLWLTRRDPASVRAAVWAALLLLGCSFALHSVGLDTDATHDFLNHSWGYQISGMVKHGAELAGWIFLASAMAAAWVARPTYALVMGGQAGAPGSMPAMTKVGDCRRQAGQVVR